MAAATAAKHDEDMQAVKVSSTQTRCARYILFLLWGSSPLLLLLP
jgi:hypothetical protein